MPDIYQPFGWTGPVEVGEHWHAIVPDDDVTSLVACILQGTILRPRLHDVSFIAASGRVLCCSEQGHIIRQFAPRSASVDTTRKCPPLPPLLTAQGP